MPEITSALNNIVLFEDLTETELEQVAERVSSHIYPLGEYLFIAGTPRNELFIIQSGEVEIQQGIGCRNPRFEPNSPIARRHSIQLSGCGPQDPL